MYRPWDLVANRPSMSASWGCHPGCKGPLAMSGAPQLTHLQTARTASLSPSLWTAPCGPQVSREQLGPCLGLVAAAMEGSVWRTAGAVCQHAVRDSGPLRGRCRMQDKGYERSCVGRARLQASPARYQPADGRPDGRCEAAQKAALRCLQPGTGIRNPRALEDRAPFPQGERCHRDPMAGFQTQGTQHKGPGDRLPSRPGQTGRAKRGLGGDRGASSWRLSCPSPHRHFWAARLQLGQEDGPSEAGV